MPARADPHVYIMTSVDGVTTMRSRGWISLPVTFRLRQARSVPVWPRSGPGRN